tara:strand:+ start:35 stop:376 length:342 start_codon:yes stop_codon:yes gene_type:complete
MAVFWFKMAEIEFDEYDVLYEKVSSINPPSDEGEELPDCFLEGHGVLIYTDNCHHTCPESEELGRCPYLGTPLDVDVLVARIEPELLCVDLGSVVAQDSLDLVNMARGYHPSE